MTTFPIDHVISILREATTDMVQPMVDGMDSADKTPFRVLIATILSLRTRDTLTITIAPKLFKLADTPSKMLELSEETIAETIYPVGFYRNKAKSIRQVCQILLDEYDGKVPADLDALLDLPGVGRKTANLVLTAGFGMDGICVDTHVHRITNRWGYVDTKKADHTEFALREILPLEYWQEINKFLVMWGQNICTPRRPKCSQCPLDTYCPKIGVEGHR